MFKRMLFVLLMYIITAASGWTENVFVYIEKGLIDIEDEVHNKFSPELLNVIEDGVMESFFEQGHIVFAANSSKTTYPDERVLNQAAKRGGAELLLKAVINYSVKNNTVAITGNYVFYNLYSDSILTEGNYELPEDFDMAGIKVEELFFSIGKSFAERVSGTI